MIEYARGGTFRWRTGCVLVGLGAFLLVTGILLRTYVYGQVAVVPLDTYSITRLHATGATFFDPKRLATRTGLDVTAVSTLRGDVRAAHGNVAVFDTFLAVQAADGSPIEFVRTRSAIDRHTGLLLNCCGVNINGNYRVHESGLSFKFPFFARQTSYQVFDADVHKIVPAVYTGEQTLGGMRVYQYDQVLPPTQISARQVPASIMGVRRPRPAVISVRTTEATTMTFWIDPVTGVPIKVEQNTRQVLQTLDGKHSLLVFAADLRQRPGDVAASVSRYQGKSFQLNLVRNVLPPVDMIGGAALIPIGLLLGLGARRRASLAPVSAAPAAQARAS